MQVKYGAAILCLSSALAMSQNSGNGSPSTQNAFHGIKVVASTFVSSTWPQTVQLDVINDSPNNITGWAYCVYAEKTKESDPSQGVCTFTDAVGVEVDRLVQERITLQTNPADCPSCDFVRPGQHKIFTASFPIPVVSAEVRIKMLVYSNGEAETSGDDQGAEYLQLFRRGRQMYLQQAQEVSDLGRRILADATDPHPVESMISELEARSKTEPGIDNTLYFFKRPEWRRANNKEFVPGDERSYLSGWIREYEMKAAEYSKYLIPEVR